MTSKPSVNDLVSLKKEKQNKLVLELSVTKRKTSVLYASCLRLAFNIDN